MNNAVCLEFIFSEVFTRGTGIEDFLIKLEDKRTWNMCMI